MLKIGFLGAGKMAQALAQGFIKSGLSSAEKIIASSPVTDQMFLDEFKRYGCQTTNANSDVAKSSDIIIVATKPHVVPQAVTDINTLSNKQLLLSIAMGITTRDIEKLLPAGSRVIRVMPNTPALVQCGMSVYAKGQCASVDDGQLTKKLFESVGVCEEVPESLFDPITGLSGAGPAYIYIIIEALADGGVKMGIPRDLAYKLAANTVLGASKMVIETKRHPGALKDDVCSPSGCTIEGVYQLERAGIRAGLIAAVAAATNVCRNTSSEDHKVK